MQWGPCSDQLEAYLTLDYASALHWSLERLIEAGAAQLPLGEGTQALLLHPRYIRSWEQPDEGPAMRRRTFHATIRHWPERRRDHGDAGTSSGALHTAGSVGLWFVVG